MIQEGKYIGNELELFEHAHNWKLYLKSKIAPYLKGDVLEVGAGIGGTTSVLCDGVQDSWLCLEPDSNLCEKLSKKIKTERLPSICSAQNAYLRDLPTDHLFDAILYIDVIEHIDRDKEEVELAFRHLRANGKLIILVPAFQYLYSPFDKKVGHYRRYSRKRLQSVIPVSAEKLSLDFLDTAGFLASLANKLILKKETPSKKDVLFWDRILIPVSKIADVIAFYSLGKSLLGVWSKK